MIELYTAVLPEKSVKLYDVLSKSKELNNLTLLGGTALALQIRHRVSLDFDFATFNEMLPTRIIDNFTGRLSTEGHNVHEVTDTSAISRFKINTGDNLRDYARDYVINGVKVTFFTHGKNQKQRDYYQSTVKIQPGDVSFNILGIEGLKVSKTLVLADRVRSRDLYDLMILFRDYNYVIDDMMRTIQRLGHVNDIEYYKAVMTGMIPLDRNDEGLQPVGLQVDIDEIYRFFETKLEQYDINKAAEYYSKH